MASFPSSLKTITITGGANLFSIAAQYYGDAMQWNRIAQANGLVDPWVTTTVPFDLILPRPNKLASTDGVYAVVTP